jgi:acyl carrier protein phosphodiesterase
VNFVAHAHVARLLHPSDSALAFGAVLPDLASLAAVRFDKPQLDASVQEGVALHHRTDAVFHGLPAFHSGSAALRRRLRQADLSTGAVRALAHAGYELLLDGCLLERRGEAEGFSRVLDEAPDVRGAISAGTQAHWALLLASMQQEKWWHGYGDAELVARRLWRRLSLRPRLAFEASSVPAVAEAFAECQPAIRADAEGIVTVVRSGLSAPVP